MEFRASVNLELGAVVNPEVRTLANLPLFNCYRYHHH